MVTVQSEDSGIVWETASSRCSTPWASEASSPSDAYSIEGSGTQGNIVIIMDEDKIKRRKKTSSRGKLGDRFRRRLSGAAIGEERPAMIEVSVPNIRPEHPEDGQSAESKPDKDQELFNLISEGFEILNIVVPSKLPTVDEEDVTELADNLSYLEDTPKIKSKCKLENTAAVTSPEGEAIDSEETKDESQKDLSQASADEQPKKDETDLDYLEKFTLLDENAPGDVSEKLEPVEDVPVIEEPQVPQPNEKVEDKLDEDSFVIITDVEIADEHLDEVFYGASCDKEPKLPSHAKADEGHIDKESSKTLKECGSTLFGSQECILTPVYLPSGPPKIIDQDLLDEPRAMSFHYSDLYEDAIGERRKDDDFSDVESVISEKSFKRRYSDSDDADGYLEKFILKDDTPVVKDIVEEDTTDSDRMIWPQSKFEMTGCLIRVKEETEPQEEDVHVSQTNLEGRQDAIDRQIQPPGSVEGCEDAEKLKTGCVSVKGASEDCGTETGCVVATVVSHDELSQTAVTENREVPAVVEKELRVEDEMQEQTTDTVVPKRASHLVPTKNEAEDIVVKGEIETISEQKAMEGLQTSGIDAATKKIEEIKVEVVEEAKQVNESMEDTVPAVESKLPAGYGVTIKKASVASAVERLNEVAKDVHTTEERVSVEEPKEMDKDELKQELPIGDNKMLERSEGRDIEGDTVSIDKHSQNTYAPPTAPEVPETDLLPAVVLPPLLGEEVSRKEKHEPADVDVDTHTVTTEAHITEESPKVTVLPPVAIAVVANEIQDAAVDTVTTEAHITEESPKVTVLPPVAIEVVANEIPDAAVDTTLQESIGQVPEPVSGAAVDAANEVEGKPEKSRKVLLRDTHKENLWRTVEPTTPSPPKEMQDSTLMRVSPLEHLEYIGDPDEDFVVGGKLTSDTGLFSTLRSFSPHEDLSGFGRDTAELDVNKDTIEEIDYEMVTKEDAKQSGSEVTVDKEELVHEKSAEQTIEESYEFIEDLDSAQTSEPRCLIEEVEIQPMDAFCLACRCPILMSDGGHQSHEVSTLDKAYDDIKTQLSNWISTLQERSENIEDMVSELELAYNSVEEHCKDSEKAVDEQNEEVLKLVMDQYNEMSQTMEDEKKVKLEQLYDQIVSFQANIDSAKETMEKTTTHLEETDELAFASVSGFPKIFGPSFKDINTRLKTALESTMSLELGPRGLLVFEDYAKGTTGNEKKNRQVIPGSSSFTLRFVIVPQQPHLQPQEANSATSTSVTVYWTINQGDIIDCFQVYCMEEPQGVISEEYRVTVKESYCTLEELEPDKCYKVWVMAVNYTGCSLPSERLPFRTAPSVPVIQPEACTVLWDSAILRWSSAQPSAVDSFTLEYCRQYAVEGEGLRSVSGIKGYEHKVLLQPNENFLFYIKSVNSAGASEQSEAALISTRATRFLLLSETANPVLKVSENRTSVEYPVETYNEMFSLIECPSVMGEILPLVGFHYWETVVAGCTAYRIGVAYKTAPKDSTVGDNSASWCLHCVPTSISCRFELLHDNVESDIFVIDVPVRIGTLLDFTQGRLVFFNAQNGQCLGSFQQTFSQPCYPVFVLERAGSLELKMTTEVPEFAKHW
ncbi:hypothetical protein NFI96_020681 [Prochilodus magdalenae]|nr:hypothetical protein NFI96_020681 [Prochilodus magdalenae]